MADPVPTFEPTQFRAGDSLQWDKTLEDYLPSPASPAWVLTYRLLPQVSGTARTITAQPSGNTHQVRETAATTAAWAAGDYWMVGYVTSSDFQRFEVYAGPMTILANPATAAAFDGRTYLQRVLDLIEASIESNEAPRNVIRYSYGGVTSEVRTLEEALKARAMLISAIAAETARITGKQQRVLTRFRRPR